MTVLNAPAVPTEAAELVPSRAATRAVSWIRVSVLLTIVNAVFLFFGSTINFIFGMTWSFPIEDLAYRDDNALGGLLIAIALALPMLWIANRALRHPRLMLSIAAAVYLLGAVIAIGLYGDGISMAGQLVIVVLAVLGVKDPVAVEHVDPDVPTDVAYGHLDAPVAAPPAAPMIAAPMAVTEAAAPVAGPMGYPMAAPVDHPMGYTLQPVAAVEAPTDPRVTWSFRLAVAALVTSWIPLLGWIVGLPLMMVSGGLALYVQFTAGQTPLIRKSLLINVAAGVLMIVSIWALLSWAGDPSAEALAAIA